MKKGIDKVYRDTVTISYMLLEENSYNVIEHKVLMEQEDTGFLNCYKSYYNGKVKLLYDISDCTDIKTLLERGLTEEEFFHIMYEVVLLLVKCEEIGYLNQKNISLKMEDIFLTMENQVKLLYLPIEYKEKENVFVELQKEMETVIWKYNYIGKWAEQIKEIKKFYIETAQQLLNLFCNNMKFENSQKKILQYAGETTKQQGIVIECKDGIHNMSIRITNHMFILGKGNILNGWDLRFNPAISKVHAQIINKSGKFYIEDLNSTNGTYVNGEQLRIGESRLLSFGDRILLADTKFEIIKTQEANN